MNKRIVCFLLALVMVLGLFPTTAITANAVSKLTTSDKAINVLKEYIEFKENAEEENGKWYIGYGSEISASDAANKYLNGISKADALVLLQKQIENTVDKAINAFTEKNNVDLTQYEHDALALFTYNKGTGWTTNSSSAMYQAVRTGKTGMDFVEVIASEQYVGFDVSDGESFHAAINRRLSEANMYLNNSYGYQAPGYYSYVILDLDGDERMESSDTYMLYNSSQGQMLSRVPTAAESGGCDPDAFIGWYEFDGRVDGVAEGAPVLYLDKDTVGVRLVAKFYMGNASGSNAPVNANYTLSVAALSNPYVFSSIQSREDMSSMNNSGGKIPDMIYDYVGTLDGSYFEVTKEAVVDDMYWVYGTGEDANDNDVTGWVYAGEMYDLNFGTSEETIMATATVKAATLNVRDGATENSEVIDTLTKGQVVNIYATKVEKTEVGNKTWGKVNYEKGGKKIIGWINLAYTDVLEYAGDTDSAEYRKATVVNTDFVNVRSSAEIKPDNIITSLPAGTEVYVTKTKMNGNAEWAHVLWSGLRDGYTEGWVYIHYLDIEGLEHSTPEGGDDNGEKILYTGVVNSNINLNVRKSPSVTAATNGKSLPNGTKINIYEVKTASNGVKWGRIGEDKWVCLQYVTLTEVDNSSSSNTTTTSLQATVTVNTLDILKNYNSNAAKVGTLKKGDVVTILERNTEKTETGSRIWGRIIKDNVEGWINLAYAEVKTVTSVNGGSTSGTNTGDVTVNSNGANAVVSNCISVNVRKGAGVTKEQITRLNNGTAIKVYEQVTKDSAPWARITWQSNGTTMEGWVCMNYVTMAAAGTTGNTNGSVVNGTNSNTISATGRVNSNIALKVRAGAGLGYAQIGSLTKGTQVTIYEQVTNDGMIWGRIITANGSGWVCMSYITVDNTSVTGKGVMGTIARCFAAVNVRSAPGTGNALVGTISVGNRVEIFESREYSNQMWYRVAQGWICGDYVLLDSELPPGTALDATVPTSAPTTAPNTPAETVNRDNEVLYTINGTVNVNTADNLLNVRNDADTDSLRVGTVKNGMTLKILAVKCSNAAELWGRIDQYATAGWVNMKYVDYSVHGYINTDYQPVYADSDTSSTVKGTLRINTEYTFYKLTVSGDTVYGWYQEGDLAGWIPMGRVSDKPVDVDTPYMYTSTQHPTGPNMQGKTNASINAYVEAGSSEIVYKIYNGAVVYINEIDLENGVAWGKVYDGTDFAWVDLRYVTYKLTGAVNSADGLNVRKEKVITDDIDPEVSNILGVVANGSAISICELSFDSYGNLWGKVVDNASHMNGGYVMMDYVNTAPMRIDQR